MRKPEIETKDELGQVSELVRSFDTPAPESLHRAVESMIAAPPGARRRQALVAWRPAWRRPRPSAAGVAFAGAVALAAVAIIIAVDSGDTTTPSLREAAAPTLLAATRPAPPESPSNSNALAANVDGVAFPYWEERLGWRSTGERQDRIDGRLVTTVFYADRAGQRVGYAILAGAPAPSISGGTIVTRGGVPYTLLKITGASAIAWLRDGHLCVVSGAGIANATLLRLASSTERGASSS